MLTTIAVAAGVSLLLGSEVVAIAALAGGAGGLALGAAVVRLARPRWRRHRRDRGTDDGGDAARGRDRRGSRLTVARPFVLVLGGTRSGKSQFALDMTRSLAGDGRAWFIATALPGDPELDRRIARHRRDRPAGWPTFDAGTDLAAAIRETDSRRAGPRRGPRAVAVGLTGDEPADIDGVLDGPVAALDAIGAHRGPLVVVSDEVELGMVPLHPVSGLPRSRRAHPSAAGRRRRRGPLVIAGLPMKLKGEPAMSSTTSTSAVLRIDPPLDDAAIATARAISTV